MGKARVLMVQGTASSVGKSWLVAALCRAFARRGWRVAPFKAQNMSNNAAVCPDGSEISRAQALQARAAGVEPVAAMNPILVKPEADSRAQVVVLGKPWRTLSAGEFYRHKAALWPVVTSALDRLRDEYDLVLIEGAGSPAELNLKHGDIVNMAVAKYAQAPVLLVGDIDRGGIFAQLLGTLWLLPPKEQELVRGFVVNKFRGDPTLFEEGIRILEERSGRRVVGVVPYIPDLFLPEEDAATLGEKPAPREHPPGVVEIAVVQLPRIANFDDFDPLAAEPDVRVRFVRSPAQVGRPDAVVLPGSKSTVADLQWLERTGWADWIRAFAAAGGHVVGICGGYQMLGEVIHDPEGVESPLSFARGLGLLPVRTTFRPLKETHQVRARVLGGPAWLASLAGSELTGYEIHMGRTETRAAWVEICARGPRPVRVLDGAVSPDGRIWGCYLHGLFYNDAFRRHWLAFVRQHRPAASLADNTAADALVEQSIDRMAAVVERTLDMAYIESLLARPFP